MWHHYLFMALQLAASAYAIGWGGKPERYVGILFLAAYELSELLWRPGVAAYLSLRIGVLAIDALVLLALMIVAWRADRRWPVMMAAFAVLTLMGHGVRKIDLDVGALVYHMLIIAWSYPMVLLLVVATWRHRRRAARTGPELDWTPRTLA